MKKLLILFLLSVCTLTIAAPSTIEKDSAFSFAVLANAFKTQDVESALRDAISETDEDNLAFVVSKGMKSHTEDCSDELYFQRRALLDDAKNGLVLSLASSDWVNCKRGNGRSAAIERLSRIRELFFSEKHSFGDSKIPVVRQSVSPQFRNYGENARWRFGEVLFATVNLPANNNNYVAAAGRNNEFEDRMIANREWLEKIFTFANREKLAGVVLFTDADPFYIPSEEALAKLSGKRDGFIETRRLISSLAKEFPGKILIIHSRTSARQVSSDKIVWRNNIGKMNVSSGWVKVGVDHKKPGVFSVPGETKTERKAQ